MRRLTLGIHENPQFTDVSAKAIADCLDVFYFSNKQNKYSKIIKNNNNFKKIWEKLIII